MTIDFTCRKCDAAFELDAESLTDGTEKLQCPNCDAKAASTVVEEFTSALTELRTQAAALSKKFAVSLAIETEDEVEEEVDEDDDDAEEDDDLDFDDDEDEDDLDDEQVDEDDDA